jgi:hypothetical protein
MKTLVSLIPDNESAAQAAEKLHTTGISRDRRCILCQPVEVWKRLGGDSRLHMVMRHAGYGALLGLAVGLLYGVPAGIMNCRATSCTVNTSLVFLTAISLFWVISGAFLGAIVGLDRLEKDLYSYVEGVRRGGALVMVDVPGNQADAVTRMLKEEHGLLVHQLDDF